MYFSDRIGARTKGLEQRYLSSPQYCHSYSHTKDLLLQVCFLSTFGRKALKGSINSVIIFHAI